MKTVKDIAKEGWVTRDAMISSMTGTYPYYFWLAHKEDILEGQNFHHWYEVCNAEEEKLFTKHFSKNLRYKGTRIRP